MVLCYGKVDIRRPSFVKTLLKEEVGIAHSSLPQMVYLQAKHILTHPDRTRPGIQLLSQQLVASKMASFVYQPLVF
jgi:hypothetical protein